MGADIFKKNQERGTPENGAKSATGCQRPKNENLHDELHDGIGDFWRPTFSKKNNKGAPLKMEPKVALVARGRKMKIYMMSYMMGLVVFWRPALIRKNHQGDIPEKGAKSATGRQRPKNANSHDELHDGSAVGALLFFLIGFLIKFIFIVSRLSRGLVLLSERFCRWQIVGGR